MFCKDVRQCNVYPCSDAYQVREGPFDIQGGGGWDFFEKNSLFPNRSEKNKMSSMKLKIKVCSSFGEVFRSPFPWEL